MTWVLSGYFACLFGVLGIWLPYWPLYLASLGCDARQIGLLFAFAQGIKVIGPPIWGHLADHGSRKQTILFTSWATLAAFGLFWLDPGFPALLMATAIFSFFQGGPLALIDVATMETVARVGGNYGRIRVWGSIGFMLLSLGMGPVIAMTGLTMVPWSIALLLLTGALLGLLLPETTTVHEPPTASHPPFRVFHHVGLRRFYLTAILLQSSHGAYYGFFSVHLTDHGFSPTMIGLLWALGVLAEIIFLAFADRLVNRFGINRLVTAATLSAVIRWGLYAMTVNTAWLLLGQTLHAFTFGAFHVAAVRRIHDCTPSYRASSAQAWYGGLSFGMGGGLGLLLSGYLYPEGGNHLFAVMAAVALAAYWAGLRANDSFINAPGPRWAGGASLP